MIKAILMDFNGIIVNDEPLQMQAYQQILKDDGIDLTEAEYYSCLGMDDVSFVEAAYKRAGKKVAAEKVSEITTAKTAKWREFVDEEIPLFDGVKNFIKKMEKDFALGVVSMARREEIEYVLEKTELLKSFSIIVGAENISNCKPDAECYRKGFSQIDAFRISRSHLPMTSNDCLVIEDSPPGITAGREAGLKTLGITNTVSAKELREAGADAVSKNLDDWMPDAIRRVFI
ncbi:MAG: HAD family hydrolase [Pyrinomonadaceae bacterium]